MRRKITACLGTLLLILLGSRASGTEIGVYGGNLLHSNLGGCCQSSGSRVSAGVLGTFRLDPYGEINLSAYTDGRWSEGIVSKPYYLYGGASHFDTGTGEQIQSVTLSNMRWVSAFGAGYFSHTTEKKSTDVPVLISGFAFSNINQFLYSLNDRWAAGGIAQFTIGISASDTSLLIGTFLTATYTFK